MGRRSVTVFALTAVAAMFAVPASAINCYTLLDANDTVLYRGYETPVDLSPAGAPAREALRQKKQFLMISYVDDCLLVASASETGRYGPATADEIVAGMRQFGSSKFASPGGAGISYGRATAAPPAPSSAAPAVRSGSTMQRGGY